MLTKEYIDKILPFVSMIGISVHSFDKKTKIKIGSCTKNNEVLSNEKLKFIFDYINLKNSTKEANCILKINTVVCSINKNETMKSEIENLNISKWKILKCQEFDTNANLCISENDYKNFCLNNSFCKTKQIFENTMKDTYIMLNPAGELIKQSKDGLSYSTVGSALTEDILKLMDKYSLNYELYKKRYA